MAGDFDDVFAGVGMWGLEAGDDDLVDYVFIGVYQVADSFAFNEALAYFERGVAGESNDA